MNAAGSARRALLLLGTLGAAACADAGPATDTGQLTAEPLSAAALDRATTRLTAMGARLVGTPEEDAAADEVLALFQEAGLWEVAAEPFTLDAWQPGPAWISAGDTRWEVEALSPSPATTGLEAVLTVAPGDELAGSLAVYSSDEGSRAEQFLSANSADVAAMIRVTEELDHDGGLLVEVGHTFESVKLPAVAVDRDTGEALREHAGEVLSLTIESTVLLDHESVNIVGIVPGETPSTVYVTAHYDSWHPSESAMDNALGVAVQAGLAARLAAGPTPRKTVVFLATSGEEQGLQGAIAWTAAHAEDIEAHGDDVLNLDIPWSAEGSFWCNSTDPDMAALAVTVAEELGLYGIDGGGPSASSDHVPFQGRGLEATWLTRQPDRHYHTTEDLQEWLDFEEVARAAEVNWAVLAELAGVD